MKTKPFNNSFSATCWFSGAVSSLIVLSISDVLLTNLGIISYLIPIMLVYQTWLVYRMCDRFDFLLFCLRIVGFCLVIVSVTALAALHTGLELDASSYSNGGILGTEVGEAINAIFGFIGGSLLLAALFLFGLTIFSDLSWIGIMDMIGAATLQIMSKNSLLSKNVLDRLRRKIKQSKAYDTVIEPICLDRQTELFEAKQENKKFLVLLIKIQYFFVFIKIIFSDLPRSKFLEWKQKLIQ